MKLITHLKTASLYFFLAGLLLVLAGCDSISFKRKSDKPSNETPQAMEEQKLTSQKDNNPDTKGSRFSKNRKKETKQRRGTLGNSDKQIITAYYKDPANAQILEDMVNHTRISSQQASKLKVTKPVPRDIRVIPLPLELEKILTPLNSRVLRVQIGKRIVIMDVKSRQIVDMIELKL